MFFSLQSKIFYLDNLAYTFINLLVLSCIVIISLLVFSKKNHWQSLFLFLKKHQKIFFWSFFIFCILYQLFLFLNLKSQPTYDAELLLGNLNSPHLLSDYLSINSNNRFIFFFNYLLSHFIGTSISNFQFFNAVIIFLSMLIFKKIVKLLFNDSISYVATILLMFYSIIQPLYLVPYTDTYSLFPMFLSVYFLLMAIKQIQLPKIILYSILSGLSFSICYLIRPSAIIFGITIFIFILFNITNKKLQSYLIKILPGFLSTSLLTMIVFNMFIDTQNIVKIDRSKEIPLTHFLLLGSSDNEDEKEALHGTWNSKDIETTYAGNTKAEKSVLAFNALKERTKNRGLSRTIKFYLQKHAQNTDSGVVGYHRDGLWLRSVYSSEKSFQNKIQQIFYQDGKLRPTFNFICQIIWIFTLFFVMIGLLKSQTGITSLISLSLFGGLLFLLLFESGGTKYLFQYLPWICLLSSTSFRYSVNKL